MTALEASLVVLAAVVLAPSAYLLALSLAALVQRRTINQAASATAPGRFVVLIPAHNEEQLLPRLLASIGACDYPSELYETFVVADNCTDGTAEVARKSGATVFERHDTVRRGKGYALRWLFDRIEESGRGYDACVLLDADSEISRNFLQAVNARLSRGSVAVQAYYTVSSESETLAVGLRRIALALKHYARPLGRRLFGLSCGLYGTGMAFRRQVVRQVPWDSFTLAEDIEQFLKLIERGVVVDFAHEAVVQAYMPASFKAARQQNLRWEKGRLAIACRVGVPLAWRGLVRRSPVMFDAAVEQLIPPISLLFIGGLGVLVVTLLWGGTVSTAVSVSALGCLAGHVVFGLASAPVPLRTYRFLLGVPAYALWKLTVYLDALRSRNTAWVKTRRT